MEEESNPSRSFNFFKWVLLAFAILTPFSLVTTLILGVLLPRSEQSYPQSFLIMHGVSSMLFVSAFFAIKNRKLYGPRLAALTFALADCNVIWGLFWYFFDYDGQKNIFGTLLVITLDIVQFVLFGWGALTFAFPPRINPEVTPPESHFPPPPPSFDS